MQKFDFAFEEEDTIDGMKKMIVEEVNSFRAEVRQQARSASNMRRQDRFVLMYLSQRRHSADCCDSNPSLPIPSRDEIIASPVQEHGPVSGATSGYTGSTGRPQGSPVMDDPSAELDRELAKKARK